ncbi:rhomboid family intramembrane serine protease [Paenibacillus xerothermodurans]|uniref:Rhomboid family intramembrane serine protease n=1 Tax=Paenibacillus xerothermodurans TaxID=1977292 RepID=A0A2W1NX21_PAEXE|nr:rhomboid family intramembrane serine protease [Paenibacillus xerothermodurans]PZE22266.1 rhomboid family intramembrane serine protease [Paenibacillus xerothermodurans]
MFIRRESLKQYVRLYPVTSAVILIHLLVMAAMEWEGSTIAEDTLLRFGAMFDLPGMQPELWRYVSSIFIHIGWEHLLFNSFALYVFAAPLERLLGSARYAVFYLACGIIGNAASAWLHADYYIGAGASGAIYGVYAAYLYLSIFRKDLIDYQSKQTVMTILIIGFVYSFVIPNVDVYAHTGGFVGGLLLTAVLSAFVKRRQQATSWNDHISQR